ncbi:hypothetical protein RIR_jg23354.t1 [Rhizophagus irregularis DAOM 181602=DAOM 197198]|nr:hypothetical protein RIR_jg23354.t1 [Rhizophagus irregularis DAOM 181602=DAOM 197198]
MHRVLFMMEDIKNNIISTTDNTQPPALPFSRFNGNSSSLLLSSPKQAIPSLDEFFTNQIVLENLCNFKAYLMTNRLLWIKFHCLIAKSINWG